MKYIHQLLLALAVLVLPVSCIKEDMDDCNNVTIYFQYFADGDMDVFYKYMTKVDLYVFDEDGHIKGVGHYNEDELKDFAAVPSFKFLPGRKYKVVVVGNAYDATEVVNLQSTSFKDIFLQNPHWDDSERVTNHDDNYLGQLEFTMPEKEGTMYRDTVTLYSAHLDVNIEIYGLPAPQGRQKENIPYELRIENSNAQCSFDNEINSDRKAKCTIYPDLIYDYDKQCYRTDDFALFRMDNQFNGKEQIEADYCEHLLVLREKNAPEDETLFSAKLYDYITENEKIEDLVLKQEALLPVNIEFHDLVGVVTVPDWVIVDGKPDWN